MAFKKEKDEAEINLVHSAFKELIVKLEAKKDEYEESGFPWASEPEDVVWLLGFSPEENHRLNWILHGQENVIQDVMRVH